MVSRITLNLRRRAVSESVYLVNSTPSDGSGRQRARAGSASTFRTWSSQTHGSGCLPRAIGSASRAMGSMSGPTPEFTEDIQLETMHTIVTLKSDMAFASVGTVPDDVEVVARV